MRQSAFIFIFTTPRRKYFHPSIFVRTSPQNNTYSVVLYAIRRGDILQIQAEFKELIQNKEFLIKCAEPPKLVRSSPAILVNFISALYAEEDAIFFQ